MNKNDKIYNDVSPELNDDALESVAGGRGADEYNFFGSVAAQADTVKILLHSDPMPEED